jgi:hypothetical protein
MSSRGRVKQLERIHSEIAGGGSCFTTRALKKYLGIEVNTDMLPTSVYFSDVLDAYQGEITRLNDQEEYLKYQINQFKVKKRMHLANYDQLVESGSSSSVKESRLNLIVEEARELPAMNTNNTADPFFTVKCDEKLVHTSSVIPDTADPVWSAHVSVPVSNKHHLIEVEVWDDDTNPEFIGSFFIEVDSYSDQQAHTRWYDLEGPEGISNGEVKVIGQWIYDLLSFHQMYIEKYDHLINVNEKTLGVISEHVNKLYTLDGKDLLIAWLTPPQPPAGPKSRRSQHYLSIPTSRNNSIIGSPRTSPTNRPNRQPAFDLSPERDDRKISSPLAYSHRPQRTATDYFAVGMYLTNRAKARAGRK